MMMVMLMVAAIFYYAFTMAQAPFQTLSLYMCVYKISLNLQDNPTK